MSITVLIADAGTVGSLSSFFTWASFGSLIGLTGITYVVTNTARVAGNFNPRWFGLVVAIVATEMGVYLTHPSDPLTYVLGLLNGCLVFLTAAGSATAGDAAAQLPALAGSRGPRAPGAKPAFYESWF
jgi:hypothetical protein